MRFKVLQDGRLLDTLVNKKFNPRSDNNRAWAATLEKAGNTELRDILKRIDASETHKTRMAGNALEKAGADIIAELRGERDDSVIQNAMDDLYSLREINKDIDSRWKAAASQAGLSKEEMLGASNIKDRDIQLVGNIDERVPEALNVKWDDSEFNGARINNETRLHTRFERNPVTGQQDVVPFIAEGENVPLVTQFGLVGKDIDPSAVDNMDTDEFLGKRILQLAGMNPVRNNDADVYAVDLLDKVSGNKVDVEMLKSRELKDNNTVGFQVYTEMAPNTMAGYRDVSLNESRRIASEMVSEMKPMIKQRMASGNMSIGEAIKSLEREGSITNSDGRYGPNEGKLLKEGGNYVDQLVQPVVSNRDAALNLQTKQGRNDTRKLVMPLEGALLSDANAAKQRLADIRGTEALSQVSLRPMPGNNGSRPSGKLYLEVPANDRNFVTDLGALAPAVRQLFGKQ